MSLVRKLPPEEREIPHEPGNHMSFRPLSGLEIEEAKAGILRELGQRFPKEAMETFNSLQSLQRKDEQQSIELVPGEDGQYKAGRIDSRARDTEAELAARDPLASYSVRLLLRYGLVSWRGPKYDGQEPSEENKDDLDAVTRRWAALQVVDLSEIDGLEVTVRRLGEERSSVAGSEASATEPVRLAISSASGSQS